MIVLLITPFSREFEDIVVSALEAAIQSTANLITSDEIYGAKQPILKLKSLINKSDLIIVDISLGKPYVTLQYGYAIAMKKPILLISEKSDLTFFDMPSSKTILYDRLRLQDTLTKPLTHIFSTGDWKNYIVDDRVDNNEERENVQTVFVSYSHQDSEYLNRLKIHLRPFEKNGSIDLWADTKIKVGEKWKEKINLALDKSVIAILLISADFLASDFIVDNELPPLLKKAEEKGKYVLPVIIKPCRFIQDANLSQFQAINDPKTPLSKMNETEREEIYVKIADSIAGLLKK